MLISDVGERGLIERIRARAPKTPTWVRIGIGDDAAVIEPARGELDVVTTDCQIEGVHFRRDWTPMFDIGRKALAVNVSDLAAMGATPRAATLSLALPPTLPLIEYDALIDGFLSLAAEVKVPLVGGNISRSPGPVVIDGTLIGSARPRRVLTRSGGRAGHLLYVTGTLGHAAAEVARREGARAPDNEGTRAPGAKAPDGGTLTPGTSTLPPWNPAPLTPLRLSCGQQVARNRVASACMDISDGLADAVTQIAEASGTGARIDSSKIPVDSSATLEQALRGGEDYELLFAVPLRRRRGFELIAGREATVTCVGELTATPGVVLLTAGGATEPLGGGFSHF